MPSKLTKSPKANPALSATMVEQFDEDYFHGKKKSNYSDYGAMVPSRQFRSVISFIKNREPSGSFLDIGCAFGLLLKEVSPFFDEVSGCDISRYAIQKARRIVPKANLAIVNVDESLPYVDESFDCIAALDILEHTSNLERNFERIVSKLRKGGYLFISVPIDSWPRRLFGFLDRDETHISIPKEEGLMQIVNKSGLRVVSKKHSCPTPIFYKIPLFPAEIELILKKE